MTPIPATSTNPSSPPTNAARLHRCAAVFATHTGLWSHGGQGAEAIIPYDRPEGHGRDTTSQDPDEALHIGAPVGRIGTNLPFRVRHRICFIPRTTGELRLSMNDQPGTFGNDTGSLRVQVATFPLAAMPRRVTLTPQNCPIR